MIWIKFNREKKVFKLDVFAQLTKHILIDDSFKNSIDFFKLGDSFYAISGTNSKGDKLAITYLDFSKIDSELVIERLIKIFTLLIWFPFPKICMISKILKAHSYNSLDD